VAGTSDGAAALIANMPAIPHISLLAYCGLMPLASSSHIGIDTNLQNFHTFFQGCIECNTHQNHTSMGSKLMKLDSIDF
jgi:hypothetical protein